MLIFFCAAKVYIFIFTLSCIFMLNNINILCLFFLTFVPISLLFVPHERRRIHGFSFVVYFLFRSINICLLFVPQFFSDNRIKIADLVYFLFHYIFLIRKTNKNLRTIFKIYRNIKIYYLT